MTGILWYSILVLIGLAAVAYTMYIKNKYLELYAFLLFIIAASYAGEYFLLGLWDGYAYKPGIMSDPIADSLTGHLLCNTALYGGIGLLVSVFLLHNYWIILISLSFMLIEFLFLRLGIYEHNWWKTYLTGIVVMIFLIGLKMWYKGLLKRYSRLLRYLTFNFIIISCIHLIPAFLLPFEKQKFRINWFDNMYKDSSMFAFVYHTALAIICTPFVINTKGKYWKHMPILICFLSNYLLTKMNILIFDGGWNLLYLTLVDAVLLYIIILNEKRILPLRQNGNASIFL